MIGYPLRVAIHAAQGIPECAATIEIDGMGKPFAQKSPSGIQNSPAWNVFDLHNGAVLQRTFCVLGYPRLLIQSIII